MVKRWLAGLLVVVVIAGIAYTLLRLERGAVGEKDLYRPVPTDAILMLEARSLNDLVDPLFAEHEIVDALYHFKAIGDLRYAISFLDSALRAEGEYNLFFEGSPALFSLHETGKEHYDFLLVVASGQTIREKDLSGIMERIFGQEQTTRTRRYEDTRIAETLITRGSGTISFSWTLEGGYFMMSFSPLLLEDAVRQRNQETGIPGMKGFDKLVTTAGRNVEANLYVQFGELPELVQPLLQDSQWKRVRQLGHWAEWSELDLQLKNNLLQLTGFTYADPEKARFLNVIRKHDPQRITIDQVIPANIAGFFLLCFEDLDRLHQDYFKYLDLLGRAEALKAEINHMEAEFGVEASGIFKEIVSHEMAVAFMDIKNFSPEQNTFMVLGLQSRTDAKNSLEAMLGKIASKKELRRKDLIFTATVGDDLKYPMYQIPVPYFSRVFAGYIFGDIQTPFCTLIDNYLVFGHDVEALSKFVYYNLLQSTLSTDVYYRSLSDQLSARTNLMIFGRPRPARSHAVPYLREKFMEDWKKEKELLDRYESFALQFSAEDPMIFTNIFLKYSEEAQRQTRSVWESRLDTVSAFKPRFVTNHYTGDKEIFLQDEAGRIYLIGASGRILWDQPLKEPIMGEVYQVDYYKNGKLQLLFNTKNQIHLIDRNGNYVERYPISLRSPAATGISLFDYEKNKNYRIFVPTVDRSVYVYDLEGRIVEGWTFEQTDAIVEMPIQHFRVGEKDYIVIKDRVRNYILDRTGETRVKPEEQFPGSAGNSFYLEYGSGNRRSRLITTDTAGRVMSVYFDGSVESMEFGDFGPGHWFVYEDLDGDGDGDHIFVEGKELEVYDEAGKALFSRSFKDAIDFPPVVYQFSATDKRIGLVSRDLHEIYLVGNDGSMHEGFPLKGATMFSIGKLTSNERAYSLIVGNMDNFLYNYSVE